eukprot:351965-Chlamydomonas_euryale.AAC.17
MLRTSCATCLEHAGDVPEALKGRSLFALDLGSLVAGVAHGCCQQCSEAMLLFGGPGVGKTPKYPCSYV